MDIEKLAGGPTYLSGFPSLAGFIATDRDQTSAIFKRFKRLGARNLLHLQSRLAELQAELDTFDREEENRDLNTKQYSRNWETFCVAAEHDPRQKQKKVLLDKIGRTMGEYREALIYESQLASLPPPTKRTLEAFRYHFSNEHSGSSFPTLGANSAALFDDEDDLVALRGEDRDRLTAFLQDHCSWLFKTGRAQSNIVYASDRRVARVVTILSIINAAALLIGAIVSLYAITSAKTKLGVMALFTAMFAANVGVLTNARRAELFAATAAYAAVLVVFVSGGLGIENACK